MTYFMQSINKLKCIIRIKRTLSVVFLPHSPKEYNTNTERRVTLQGEIHHHSLDWAKKTNINNVKSFAFNVTRLALSFEFLLKFP